MILHTILDPMEIFYEEKNLKYCYKKVDKCMLEGVKYNNENICLSRIISTNPKDYLNPEWTPGTNVSTALESWQ